MLFVDCSFMFNPFAKITINKIQITDNKQFTINKLQTTDYIGYLYIVICLEFVI